MDGTERVRERVALERIDHKHKLAQSAEGEKLGRERRLSQVL